MMQAIGKGMHSLLFLPIEQRLLFSPDYQKDPPRVFPITGKPRTPNNKLSP